MIGGESLWERWTRFPLRDEVVAPQQKIRPRLRWALIFLQIAFAAVAYVWALSSLPQTNPPNSPCYTSPTLTIAEVAGTQALSAAILIDCVIVLGGLLASIFWARSHPLLSFIGIYAVFFPLAVASASSFLLTNVLCYNYLGNYPALVGAQISFFLTSLSALGGLALMTAWMDTRETAPPLIPKGGVSPVKPDRMWGEYRGSDPDSGGRPKT